MRGEIQKWKPYSKKRFASTPLNGPNWKISQHSRTFLWTNKFSKPSKIILNALSPPGRKTWLRERAKRRKHFLCGYKDKGPRINQIGIGGTPVLPSHTTVHAGPHTAVRRVELCVNSQAFCIVRRQETIRSLPGCPSGLHPYLPPGRPNNIGFLPRIVPEIALLSCRSL
jgi:hypothetical protein